MSFSPILKLLVMLILYVLNLIHGRLIINRFNMGHVACCHGNGGHLDLARKVFRKVFVIEICDEKKIIEF